LTVFVGGGILAYQYWLIPKQEIETPEIKPSEVETPEGVPPEEAPVDEVSTNKLRIIHPNGGEVFDLNSEITVGWSASQEFINNLEPNQIVEIYLIKADGTIAGFIASSLYGAPYGDPKCESSLLKKAGRISCIWNPQKTVHWGGLDFSVGPPKPGYYKILILSREPQRETSGRRSTLPLSKVFDIQIVYANGGSLNTFVTGYDKFSDDKIIIRDGKVEAEYELIASDVSDSDFILTVE
jgi:hypothetical protein